MEGGGFMITAAVLLAVALAGSVHGHPTRYPDVDVSMWHQRMQNGEGMPPFQSYHIHVLFISNQNDSINEAMAFRKQFMEHFKLTDDHPCNGTRHQGRLCMYTYDDESGTDDSPFVTSQWGMFLPVEHFAAYVPWTMQNRGNNIVFVHPNSGMEKEDHTHWAFWQGAIWPLRPSTLCTYCGN